MKPVLAYPAELLLKAQGIRIAFFDVDGVLTDGGLFFSEQGETLKRFHSLDGHGLKLLQRAGIVPAVITGRDSPALRKRLHALGVAHAHFGTEDKRPAAEQTLQELGLNWSQGAAMGDDWPDLAVMRRCAFTCAPANAHIEVKAHADHVTLERGGHGAVRAFCDLLLVASGRYAGAPFTVVGRQQIAYAEGSWNEWHVLFDDMRGGWLSDANGEYMLSFLTPPGGELPAFAGIMPNDPVPIAGREFVVSNREEATCVAGEGELPFAFGAGYPAPLVDLRATEGDGFASIGFGPCAGKIVAAASSQ
mgnify:CR=1 FL=1